VRQPPLSEADDAVHALLSLVPHESQEAVETREQQENLPCLPLGNCE